MARLLKEFQQLAEFKIIEVVNSSEPIVQEIYDNIFEPFVKSNTNSTEDSRGMGLFLCREILNEHNGEISIENGNEIKVKIALNILGN